MQKKHSIEEEKQELSDFLGSISLIGKIRYFLWGTLAITLLALNFNYIGLINLIVSFLWNSFLKTIKGITGKSIAHFVFQIIEIIALLALIKMSGLALFIGAFSLAIYLFISYFAYTREIYRWAIFILCLLGYFTLITLEYVDILGFEDITSFGIKLADNFSILIMDLLPGASLMSFLFYLTDTFAKRFQKLLKALFQRKEELQDIKNILEEKVSARTKELKDLADSLDKQVRIRTKELEIAKAVAESEKNKTLSIINNLVDGLIVFNRDNNLDLINSQAKSFLRLKEEDVIGKSMSSLKKTPHLEPLINLIEEETGETFRKEVQISNNNHEDGLVLSVSTIYTSVKGEKIGMAVILHDITREKIIERMKTEFVSITAHQLRTPLSAIKWTLKMFLDGDLGSLEDKQKEFIKKTYQSNERMIKLINSLLDVTRIEEGRYIFKPTFTSLENMVDFVIKPYKEEFEKRKLAIEFKKPKKRLPQVKIDIEKIRLVIQNLVDNAMRYTPAGGQVTISLKMNIISTEEKEIEFSIKDTGLGVPSDQQKRIFGKFFRANNVIKTDTEGSGLGLFIAKNIIEAHGGKIWFESLENKGTTFYFTIPIKK